MRKKIPKRVTDRKLHRRMKDRFKHRKIRFKRKCHTVNKHCIESEELQTLYRILRTSIYVVKREKREKEVPSGDDRFILQAEVHSRTFRDFDFSLSSPHTWLYISHTCTFRIVEKEQFSMNSSRNSRIKKKKKPKAISRYKLHSCSQIQTHRLCILLYLSEVTYVTQMWIIRARRCKFLCSFFSSDSSTICHDRANRLHKSRQAFEQNSNANKKLINVAISLKRISRAIKINIVSKSSNVRECNSINSHVREHRNTIQIQYKIWMWIQNIHKFDDIK